jgi:hypothetical protein
VSTSADRDGDVARTARPTPARRADDLLPEQTADDRPESWGEVDGGRDDEWFLRERPPHHGD